MPAAFGPLVNESSWLIAPLYDLSKDSQALACNNVTKAPKVPPTLNATGWIALIQRGGCNFIDKVLQVQTAGYIGAVVSDNAPHRPLITMYSAGT